MHGTRKNRPDHPVKSIHYSRVISLSREIYPAMPTWPEDPRVEFQTASQLNTQGYYSRRFSMSEHGGTHINAPNSFHDDGSSIDQYPAESLVVSAVVVDAVEQVRANSDYAMTVDDLAGWEGQHGPIPAGSVVLLYTGWASKWSRAQEYLGTSPDGGLHFPGFSAEVVKRFLNDRNAGGLGIDTPGVEPGIDLEFKVNRLALEQRRIVLENLCNLGSLPATGVTLAIGLLRLRGGTGSPASVLAFVP